MEKKYKVVTIPKSTKSVGDLIQFMNEYKIEDGKGANNWQPQQFLILSDDAIQEGDVATNNLDGITGKVIREISQAEIKAKEYSKVIATHPAIPDVHEVSISDIQQWVNNGYPDEVQLECIELCGYCFKPVDEPVHHYRCGEKKEIVFPKLTGNKVICIWESPENPKSDWQVIGEDIAKNYIRKEMWKDKPTSQPQQEASDVESAAKKSQYRNSEYGVSAFKAGWKAHEQQQIDIVEEYYIPLKDRLLSKIMDMEQQQAIEYSEEDIKQAWYAGQKNGIIKMSKDTKLTAVEYEDWIKDYTPR